MHRRQLLSGALAAPFLRAAGQRRLNVVFFLTDDHGFWASSPYGCTDLHTPNLQRLADGGVRFTRAFSCTPVCSPSRMTYMTGLIPSQHGVQDWLLPEDSYGSGSHRFLDGHITYSEILASHGYTLGMAGKWHMGLDDQAQAGFSWWATVPGGGGTYRDPEFVKNGRKIRYRGYKTDAIGDYAIEFLNLYHDRPFWLQVPFYAPHTPYTYQPETYRQWYDQSQFSCFPNEPMNPWQEASDAVHHGKREPKHAYSALITGMDYNLGRIVRRLEELGVRDNTLIIFTADQGWNAGHHGVWGKGNGTIPLNMYEESLHVPLIWNLPGRIRAGQTLTPMVSNYDFFPTILDYLGVPVPKSAVRRPGRSYAAFLRGESPAWRNRLYFEYEYVRGIRTENLKYIERTRKWPSELFDLEADPGERRNVIDDPRHRKELSALRRDMHDFFHQHGAPALEDWRSTTTQHIPIYKRYSDGAQSP
ncbi:MAG TPA: sulfatase-like hydrolase/transferase [Bryobacteraceae bacterium]|nr:sulfatase-like hydrolase/transferase [Bryobacteraceae bacterium]